MRWTWAFLSAIGLSASLLLSGINQKPTAANSDQAEQGARVYAQRCITCHGDAGQGLAKWRLTWDEQHQNCSVPKCHGLQHPPEGFYLPNNYAPAIMGENTLTRFQTAKDLYYFISTRMPYQAPGELTSDDYWALVAFLLRENGFLAPGIYLDAMTANYVRVNPTSVPLTSVIAIGVAFLTALALGSTAYRRLLKRG